MTVKNFDEALKKAMEYAGGKTFSFSSEHSNDSRTVYITDRDESGQFYYFFKYCDSIKVSHTNSYHECRIYFVANEVCADCGAKVNRNEMVHTSNGLVCSNCKHNYTRCNDCGDYYSIEYMNETRNGLVCDDCYTNYIHCDECDEWVRRNYFNVDEDMCDECYNRKYEYLITGYHSHNYYPVGNTDKRTNNWLKGIELEVDDGDYDDCKKLAYALNESINTDCEHIYFETDGSLNSGFEIITQPHTIDGLNKIDWSTVLRLCHEYDFKSHNTSTCGLHLHYDRRFFGSTTSEEVYNVGKLLAFYERFFDDLLKVSRRTQSQYEHWAYRYYAKNRKECYEIAKKNRNNDRYHAVNLTKGATIEFRLGRGTLDINSFNAWNDLHDCIVRNVKKTKYKNLDDLSVWFKGIKRETVEYIKSRNAFNDFCAKFLENSENV